MCTAIGSCDARSHACRPASHSRVARVARGMKLLGGLRVALARWRRRYAALRSADVSFRPPDVQLNPAYPRFETVHASAESADATSDARSATFATADANVD